MGQCLDKEKENRFQNQNGQVEMGSRKKSRKIWRKNKRSNKNTKESLSPSKVLGTRIPKSSNMHSDNEVSSLSTSIVNQHSQGSQGLGASNNNVTLNISITFGGKGLDKSKSLAASHATSHSLSVTSNSMGASKSSTDTVVIHEEDELGLLTKSPKKTLSPKMRSPLSPLSRKGLNAMFASPKGPRVLFKSPVNKHLAFRREKNNSTSTLFIKDTLNSPNVDEILRCMSVALLYHIKNGMKAPEDKLARVFSERYHPLTKEYVDYISLPDVSTIYRFIKLIFRTQKLPPECAILCLAYIERILGSQKIVLHPENWRRIVFGSIIIATKVWEDESVWNVDFLDLFPLLTLNDLNNTENKFLELLQFNVLIHASEYAKYYFELRALSQLDSFPLEPLNKDLQFRLELRSNSYKSFTPPSLIKDKEQQQQQSEQYEEVLQAAAVSSASHAISDGLMNHVAGSSTIRALRGDLNPKRCRSVDFFDPKSPPIVLQ